MHVRRKRRRLFALAGIAATIAIGAALSGCGSGGGAAKSSPTPATTITVLPQLTAPPELPTITDPFTADLQPRTGQAAAFTIAMPPEWAQEVAQGIDRFTLTTEGGYTGVIVTIECDPPRLNDPAMEYNSYNLAYQEQRVPGDRPRFGTANGIEQIDINGLPGALYTDQRTIGNAGTVGVNVFLAQPDCAWVLRMVQGGNGDTAKYRSLFGRMVRSFRPGGPKP